jgi:hypothetical protein
VVPSRGEAVRARAPDYAPIGPVPMGDTNVPGRVLQ